MSWYYTYFLGIRDKNTHKIDLLGIYDNNISRSFASDLHRNFYQINVNELTDKTIKKLEITSDDNCLSYLPYNELPSGDFIKRGYFLEEEIEEYEETHDSDSFYNNPLSPTIYAKKMEKEVKFGKDENEYSYKDYSFYAYPDYCSKEYESFIIKEVKSMLIENYEIPDDKEIIVLLWQG